MGGGKYCPHLLAPEDIKEDLVYDVSYSNISVETFTKNAKDLLLYKIRESVKLIDIHSHPTLRGM